MINEGLVMKSRPAEGGASKEDAATRLSVRQAAHVQIRESNVQ